jgi:hypothetical protein
MVRSNSAVMPPGRGCRSTPSDAAKAPPRGCSTYLYGVSPCLAAYSASLRWLDSLRSVPSGKRMRELATPSRRR